MNAPLPWRGLALSSNLDAADQPHPFRLLDAEPGLFDTLEYSAPLALAQAKREASLFAPMEARRAEVPVLFHPVHLNLWGPELESPEMLRELDAHALAVGSAWVGNDIAWWHAAGQPFPGYLYVTPPFDAAALEACATHALHVQSHLTVPLVLENPAVLTRRGDLHVLDFMAELHRRTGAPLLLDLGHLWSYQLAAGLPIDAALDGFPLEQVIEIHVAGGVVTRNGSRALYVDDHTQPIREELFELLERVMPRCKRLRCLTYEGDGHPDAIAAANLRRLRKWIPRELREALTWSSRDTVAPPSALDAQTPWALFREAHEAAGDDASERDFRLAVIAERVDRYYPLTRLLLAGTPSTLAAFAQSGEYLAGFEGLGKPLEDTFAAWARGEVIKRREESLMAVLAFETTASHRLSHGIKPAGEGETALAAGVRIGAFPLDLSELIFAARAVKRHLAARAWASSVLETSGLESLHQAARRAPRVMWQHALRRRAGGWESLTLDGRTQALLEAAANAVPTEKLLEGSSAEERAVLQRLAADGWVHLR